jgi:hypothetical protein
VTARSTWGNLNRETWFDPELVPVLGAAGFWLDIQVQTDELAIGAWFLPTVSAKSYRMYHQTLTPSIIGLGFLRIRMQIKELERLQRSSASSHGFVYKVDSPVHDLGVPPSFMPHLWLTDPQISRLSLVHSLPLLTSS